MLQVFVFLALAFSVLIALFAVQNTTPVTVSLLWFRAENVPVAVLVLISAALGAGVMLLLGLAREIRLQLQRMRMNKQLRKTEVRVQQLEAQQALPAHYTPEPDDLVPSLPQLDEPRRD